MCFELDSEPPIPALSGASVSYERLELTAADGNRLAAFLAEPEGDAKACVVVLPDVRGLYRFYEELALRFAERGYRTIAIDFYGRSAGAEARGEEFDWQTHRAQTTPAGVQADVGAAVERLRGAGCSTIFTVGFCFGGRHSWLAAAAGHGLAGAVGFYGRPGPAEDGSPGPAQLAAEFEAPILALQGGADQAIPVEDSEAFDAALTAAGIEHDVVVYDGAPHSFFDRKQAEFQAESDDAWARTLRFIDTYS
jgi:carboxymethylenebutenolidase